MAVANYRGRLMFLAVAVGLAVLSLTASSMWRATDDARTAPVRRAVESNPGPGTKISLERVGELIESMSGPLLPEEGGFTADSSKRAWMDEFGAFGYKFPSGLILIYQQDGRTQEEAEEAITGQVDADAENGIFQFKTEELRDTVMLEHVASSEGPASLQWHEGKVWIEVIGDGGESLDKLRVLVLSMQKTTSSEGRP